ncbi:recombinase family protein [Patescibacteria group bacterium]
MVYAIGCPFLFINNFKYMQNNLKFITYCRKSSEREDKQILSIDSQKRELKKIQEKNGLLNIATLWESKSAYKIGREKFSEMIKRIEAGEANAILTYHLTRLARNSQDGGKIIYMMDIGLIKEIQTPERSYKNTTDDKFLMQIHFAMAKKSSDDTSDFVKRDIEAKLLKGEYPCFAPKGYLNIDKDGKISGKNFDLEKQTILASYNRPIKRIERDPSTNPIIVKLFEECVQGNKTLNDLRDKSFNWGLTGVRSSKKLTKSSIHRILTNPFYYGAIRWMGKTIEPEELPKETRHEPTVSRELFNRVQEVLGLKGTPHSKKRFYSYSNLIKCGNCGGNISGVTSKGHTYYRCCSCKGLGYLREDELEKQVKKEIAQMTIDDDFYKLAIKEINKANDGEIGQRKAVEKQQRKELSQHQQRLDNLLKLKISPSNQSCELLSDEEFLQQKRETLKDMQIIREKMENTTKQSQNWFDICIDYIEFNKGLFDRFEKSSPEQKRDIFQFIYYNPTITAQILDKSEQSPHKFIISANLEKQLTTTAKNGSDKTKTPAYASVSSNWRGRRDSNPRPSA